jgi:hypothetical protein
MPAAIGQGGGGVPAASTSTSTSTSSSSSTATSNLFANNARLAQLNAAVDGGVPASANSVYSAPPASGGPGAGATIYRQGVAQPAAPSPPPSPSPGPSSGSSSSGPPSTGTSTGASSSSFAGESLASLGSPSGSTINPYALGGATSLDAWLASPSSSPNSQPLLIATGVSAAALAAQYPGAAVLNSGDTYNGQTLWAAYYIAPGQQFSPGDQAWLSQYNPAALTPVHVLDVYRNGQYVTTVTTNNMNALAVKYPYGAGYRIVNTQSSSYPTLTVNSVLESISEANATAEQSFLAGITSSLTQAPSTNVHQRPTLNSNGEWTVTVEGTKYTFQNKADAQSFINGISNQVLNGVNMPELYDVAGLTFLSQGVAQSYATGLNAAAQQEAQREAPLYEEAYLTSQLRPGAGGSFSLTVPGGHNLSHAELDLGVSPGSTTLQFQNMGQAASAIDALVGGKSVYSVGNFTFATAGAASSYLTSLVPTYSHAELDTLGMPSGFTINNLSFTTVGQAQSYLQGLYPGEVITPTYTGGVLTGFAVASAPSKAKPGLLQDIYGDIKTAFTYVGLPFSAASAGIFVGLKDIMGQGSTLPSGNYFQQVYKEVAGHPQIAEYQGGAFLAAFLPAVVAPALASALGVSTTGLVASTVIGGTASAGITEVATGGRASLGQIEGSFLFGEAFSLALSPVVVGIGALSSSAVSVLGTTGARVLGTATGAAVFGAIQSGIGLAMGGNALVVGAPSRSPLGIFENAVLGGVLGGYSGYASTAALGGVAKGSIASEVGGKAVYPAEPSPNAITTYLSTTEIGSDVTADLRYIGSSLRSGITGIGSSIADTFRVSGVANAGTTSEPGLEGLFAPENEGYAGPFSAFVASVENAATFGAFAARQAVYDLPGRVTGALSGISDTFLPGDLGLGTQEESLVPMFGAEHEYVGPVSSFIASATRSVYSAGYAVSDLFSQAATGLRSAPGALSDFTGSLASSIREGVAPVGEGISSLWESTAVQNFLSAATFGRFGIPSGVEVVPSSAGYEAGITDILFGPQGQGGVAWTFASSEARGVAFLESNQDVWSSENLGDLMHGQGTTARSVEDLLGQIVSHETLHRAVFSAAFETAPGTYNLTGAAIATTALENVPSMIAGNEAFDIEDIGLMLGERMSNTSFLGRLSLETADFLGQAGTSIRGFAARAGYAATSPIDWLNPSDEMTAEQALSLQNYSAFDYLFDRQTIVSRISTGASDVFGQMAAGARSVASAPGSALSSFLSRFDVSGVNVGTNEESLMSDLGFGVGQFGPSGVQGVGFGIGTTIREGISPVTDVFGGIRGAASEFATRMIPGFDTDVFSAEGLRLGFSMATSTLSRYTQAYLEGPISGAIMFGRAALGELEWVHLGENFEETKITNAANLEEFNNAVDVNPNVSQDFAIVPFKTDTAIEEDLLGPGGGTLNPGGSDTFTILRQEYNLEQGFASRAAAGRYGYGWLFLTTPESFAALTSGGSLITGVRTSVFGRSPLAVTTPEVETGLLAVPGLSTSPVSVSALDTVLGLSGRTIQRPERLLNIEGLSLDLVPLSGILPRFLQVPVEEVIPTTEQTPLGLLSYIEVAPLQEEQFTLLVGLQPKLLPSFGLQRPRRHAPRFKKQRYAYGEEYNAIGYEGVFGEELSNLLEFNGLTLADGFAPRGGRSKGRSATGSIDEMLGLS